MVPRRPRRVTTANHFSQKDLTYALTRQQLAAPGAQRRALHRQQLRHRRPRARLTGGRHLRMQVDALPKADYNEVATDEANRVTIVHRGLECIGAHLLLMIYEGFAQDRESLANIG